MGNYAHLVVGWDLGLVSFLLQLNHGLKGMPWAPAVTSQSMGAASLESTLSWLRTAWKQSASLLGPELVFVCSMILGPAACEIRPNLGLLSIY